MKPASPRPALRLPPHEAPPLITVHSPGLATARREPVFAARSFAVASGDHSRRVALLKRALPAIGVALLLLIAIWPRFAALLEGLRYGLPKIDLLEARELRMIEPRYAGIDRQGRPYVVTAAVGRQVPDRQDLMSLEKPRADMQAHNGAAVVVTAATGVYQQQAQLLDLFGDVTVTHQNGTRFVTEAARVDTAHDAAAGSDPVEGHGPSGDIWAQGFRIFDKGDRILFTGKSRVVLKGAKPGTQTATPPALPPVVAASAARAAAEARPLLAGPARRPAPQSPRTAQGGSRRTTEHATKHATKTAHPRQVRVAGARRQ